LFAPFGRWERKSSCLFVFVSDSFFVLSFEMLVVVLMSQVI